MSKVDEALENLIAEIKASDKYIEYRRQLDLLKAQPELKAQVDDYRKRNFELQSSDNMAFERLIDFQREFKDFRENPLVDSFLAAELDFCRMLQKINFHLTDSMDFE